MVAPVSVTNGSLAALNGSESGIESPKFPILHQIPPENLSQIIAYNLQSADDPVYWSNELASYRFVSRHVRDVCMATPASKAVIFLDRPGLVKSIVTGRSNSPGLPLRITSNHRITHASFTELLDLIAPVIAGDLTVDTLACEPMSSHLLTWLTKLPDPRTKLKSINISCRQCPEHRCKDCYRHTAPMHIGAHVFPLGLPYINQLILDEHFLLSPFHMDHCISIQPSFPSLTSLHLHGESPYPNIPFQDLRLEDILLALPAFPQLVRLSLHQFSFAIHVSQPEPFDVKPEWWKKIIPSYRSRLQEISVTKCYGPPIAFAPLMWPGVFPEVRLVRFSSTYCHHAASELPTFSRIVTMRDSQDSRILWSFPHDFRFFAQKHHDRYLKLLCIPLS
ncbi:hypothetical protein JAAARDRAFT_201000 [Jaapia argillacea MUCL 33604]|uniref:Uncharacterized protein n=1 Tax=Jaapia argillacea MUCL 33604 TaxID=933084 RepID=A0A067P5Y4_9AGAM|nr:hypothetical protein JAAARDRAFT_201000 [Jaapia argillacea MUCL 33604]